MKMNLQFFGGRGSGAGSATSGGSSNVMSRDVIDRKIDRAGFQSVGNGAWEMEIPGVGGAQVLDETGSSRALRAGFMPNEKAYSYNAWRYTDDGGAQQLRGLMPNLDILQTLNDAKHAAKDLMRNHLTR